MRAEIKHDKKRTEIVGDPEFFLWLLSAAGNARDGFEGNECELVDGEVLALVPARPEPQQPKGRLARLTATAKG